MKLTISHQKTEGYNHQNQNGHNDINIVLFFDVTYKSKDDAHDRSDDQDKNSQLDDAHSLKILKTNPEIMKNILAGFSQLFIGFGHFETFQKKFYKTY